MPYIILSSVLMILIWSAPVFAMDLDEDCSVNIMNRTVQVQPDGTWRMNNVPSFMGRVRARATCVRDGITTSGQSEFFTLSSNNLSVVEDIFFDDPSPIPVALTFDDTATIILESTSDSKDLVVRATYSDGSISSTLNASNGVNFVSSNPSIVSVDPNGELTALSSGRVFITARVEGVVALVQVTASLSGDMDGDGLPDSYEVTNGLDPNDPIDALEDSDNDGLNALEEFNAGTDVSNSDTDNDGISDSEELMAGIDGFITNPVLADTDGDGFSDGLEVDLATDPSDDTSFDLLNATESITVSPTVLQLIFNGVDTEVSDQITVMANLIDGAQKDITASSLGTTYSSADLTIASFGTNDGEIFGGVAGTTTITVSNSGYSDAITVDVERFDPVALSAIDIPGYANNVDISGDYAYVAAGSAGLVIVDVSDRTAPFILSQLDTEGTSIDVKVSGNTVYLADGAAGVHIIDVFDVNNPVLLHSVDTGGFAQDLAFDNNYLYVADGDNGLVIVNIVQPDTPFIESVFSVSSRVKGVSIDGDRLAIASTSELILVDITSRKEPVLASRIKATGGRVQQPKDVFLQGDYVYLSGLGFYIFNVSDFEIPVPALDNIRPVVLANDAVIQDDLVLVADRLFANGIPYFNISEPNNTVLQGNIDLSAFASNYGGTGISADNQYVYTTKVSPVSSNDYGINGNTQLFIAQFRQVTDNQGVAPTISFIQPILDLALSQNSQNTVEVNAQDDLAVKEVEFSVNGEVVFVDRGAPYSMPLTIGDDLTEITLSARAKDWGGNISYVELLANILPDTDRDGLSDEDELNKYFTLIDNSDSDDDGLNDYREALLGTDPNNADSDNDGIDDITEVNRGTNPLLTDTDSDGVSDFDEQLAGTDPLNSDTDFDGLSDLDEVNYLTDPLLSDTDGDGLSDNNEVKVYFTNPLNIDSDGDTIDDGREVLLGSDPNGPQDDIDNDSLPDESEDIFGTDHFDSDSDNDGVLDGIEVVQRTDPLRFDTDKDGIGDAQDTVNDWYYFINGDSIYDNFGIAVSDAGDVNNDGVVDIIIGASRDDNSGSDSGSVRVLSGIDGLVLYTFNGHSRSDLFGISVSGAGDVNNDGFDDFMVGATQDDNNGTDSGSVRVLSGIDGSTLYTFNGDSTGDNFGAAVSGAGDINNDGFDDLIIGAPRDDNNGRDSGSVRVLSGIDGSILYTFNGESADDYFGRSVSSAGDINNDGFTDLIVGAYFDDNNGSNSGSASVFSGADGSILYTLNGDSENDFFGTAVDGAGDVNNDGFDDLIVGATGDDNNGSGSGSARVFSGIDGSILYTLNGDVTTFSRAGSSVSAAGDVNNDGFNDLIVSASDSRSTGSFRVYSGVDGSAVYTIYGNSGGDQLGSSISDLGDIDNDGYADILVGAAGQNSARIISSNSDWDGDGLNTFSDPYPLVYMDSTTDYDADGVLDFDEINLDIDPLVIDTDQDGVTDGEEVNFYQSNPNSIDSDNDGIPDGYEHIHGLNLTDPGDAILDSDSDGLSNVLEFMLNIEASNIDSDGDGLQDGFEYLTNRTDPSAADTDNDGVNDNEDTVNEWLYYLRENGDRYVLPINVGDVNNDGVPDFMILSDYGLPSYSTPIGNKYYLYSGADRSLIHEFDANGLYRAAGDINNDGYDDILMYDKIGLNDQGVKTGEVKLISGFDRSVIHQFYGQEPLSGFGAEAETADMNNDGILDIVISAPNDDTFSLDGGVIYIYSGTDASLIRRINSDVRVGYGQDKIAIGDVNNDGNNDIAIHYQPDQVNYGNGTGFYEYVVILSGSDGSEMGSLIGPYASNFGTFLSLADINQDGYADVVVGADGRDYDVSSKHSGSITIYSGESYQPLYSWAGEDFGYGSPENFGANNTISVTSDVNDDTYPDIVFLARDQVYLYSGIDGELLYTLEQNYDADFIVQNRYIVEAGDIDRDDAGDFFVVDFLGNIKLVSGNGDWDGDGLRTLNDPYPIIFMDATTDYDSDGLLDFSELNTFLTDPLNVDSDADGLSDGQEINTYFSNPLSEDTDTDGIVDAYEVANDLDINNALDASEDRDNDGLNNLLEFMIGSLANNSDTDQDGLSDGDEYAGRTSVFNADTDGDGILDGQDNIDNWYFYIKEAGTDTSQFSRVAVDHLKDINNDGVDEFIFAFGDKATVYSGANKTPIYQLELNESIAGPQSAADVGDINGDGVHDFAFSGGFLGTTRDGDTVVYSGMDGTVLNRFTNPRFMGSGIVKGLTDFNNDGIPDIIIAGAGVRILSGQNGSQIFSKLAANGAVGSAVASLGDVDGDGYADIAVGSPQINNNNKSGSGNVSVYSGQSGSRIYSIDGSERNANFGISIAAIDDLDGDGVMDFAAGASGARSGGGTVTLYSGVNGSRIDSIDGKVAGNNFGFSVEGVDDINGDDINDILIAESAADDNGTHAGKITVFSGANKSIIYTASAEPGDFFGYSISSYTDIDNDGITDILVGAGGKGGHLRVISSNGDWDNDGVGTLSDAEPLNPAVQ